MTDTQCTLHEQLDDMLISPGEELDRSVVLHLSPKHLMWITGALRVAVNLAATPDMMRSFVLTEQEIFNQLNSQ